FAFLRFSPCGHRFFKVFAQFLKGLLPHLLGQRKVLIQRLLFVLAHCRSRISSGPTHRAGHVGIPFHTSKESMTLPHPAGRCRAISLLLPLCLRGKRSAPSDEHFVPADGSPCGRSNGEEPGYAAKVWPPGVGRYPWVQESSQITGASLAEFILQQLSKPELLRQIRCTRSSSIETTSWQETSCGRLGRTNVTRAVGDETRTGLSLAPSSVERQPAQCSAHFCGMADYSTVRLTVPPYAVRAFSCLLSLENIPTRVRRTDQLTVLRAYSGNGRELELAPDCFDA